MRPLRGSTKCVRDAELGRTDGPLHLLTRRVSRLARRLQKTASTVTAVIAPRRTEAEKSWLRAQGSGFLEWVMWPLTRSTELPTPLRGFRAESAPDCELPLASGPPSPFLRRSHALTHARDSRVERPPRPRPSRDLLLRACSAAKLRLWRLSYEMALAGAAFRCKGPQTSRGKAARMKHWASSLKMESWA